MHCTEFENHPKTEASDGAGQVPGKVNGDPQPCQEFPRHRNEASPRRKIQTKTSQLRMVLSHQRLSQIPFHQGKLAES